MINVETVLVMGAGASKAFNFPTGRELVMQICKVLKEPGCSEESEIFHKVTGRFQPGMVDNFADFLRKADPPSVDTWLEHNPHFIGVGKVAIAIVLLRYEHDSNLRPENNWYRLLLQKLNSPFEEFQNNRLSIVTFNYDRSLEKYLFEAFKYTHAMQGEERCREKLNQLQILHVYGSLGRLEWQPNVAEHLLPLVRYGVAFDQEDTVLSAADSIEIVPETSSELREGSNVVRKSIPYMFNEARKLIARADALYFLGFGYHETNMIRLGIDTLRKPTKIMGTAYRLDYQRIREVEQLNIRNLRRGADLVPKSVYEFLHDHVNFNGL